MWWRMRSSATMPPSAATWPINRFSTAPWSSGTRRQNQSRFRLRKFQENQQMSNSSRRTFLKASGAVAAVAITGAGRLAAKPLRQPLVLQLYSVRAMLAKDFEGTLAKVRADGYTVVEAAGYFDRTAPDFRKALDTAGMRCVSTHHALGVLETQLDQWLEYAHTLGLEYFVCRSEERL